MTKQIWNKGKSVGQKKPLSALQIDFLQEHLKTNDKIRELALFSLQIDTMLRSSDVIKLKVSDVTDFKDEVKKEINIQQKKTSQPHIVVLSQKTADFVAEYIKRENKANEDWLFTSYSNRTKNKKTHLSYKMHWLLVKQWCRILNIDPADYGTHTGRRTRAVMMYKATNSIPLVQKLLGQKSSAAADHYLGVGNQEAMDIYKEKFLK